MNKSFKYRIYPSKSQIKKLNDNIRCSCGLVIDRDLNAAINILRLGTQSLQRLCSTT